MKPVTRGCKLRPWKEWLEERFESMSSKFAWFSYKLYIKLFHTSETFYQSFFGSHVYRNSTFCADKFRCSMPLWHWIYWRLLICLPFWTLLSLKVIIMFFPILAKIYTYVNINPNLLSIDYCWVKGGVGGQFPRHSYVYIDIFIFIAYI